MSAMQWCTNTNIGCRQYCDLITLLRYVWPFELDCRATAIDGLLASVHSHAATYLSLHACVIIMYAQRIYIAFSLYTRACIMLDFI